MPERWRQFLSTLPDPARPAIAASDVAVVVAHPDDETIGCGALLQRLDGVTVAVVTDGAPRNLTDARAHGFATAAEYAEARRGELAAALELAGVAPDRVMQLGLADQAAAYELPGLVRRLVELFQHRRTRLVMTHAYEGGHPDHDATAFAVHVAARVSVGRGGPVAVVEMPFYRLGPHGMLPQSFAGAPDRNHVTVPLTGTERRLKRAMIAAHATQASTLAPFSRDVERFRRARDHDFRTLPNGGRLIYEAHDWGMTGGRWLQLAGAALSELGLADQVRWA